MSIPSNDLVHWNIVNSALPEGLSYQGKHGTTQHGNGIWAPSIRYHDGIYWIFWGDPDYGIYQVHTDSSGDDWFLHFEDRYAYGRVLHSWRAVCSPAGRWIGAKAGRYEF